ncbi:MAG TPA: T3SS effector HopA1 family protein, partial [bacterium]|nr:T3SS effector HopA1 family protein [bacterium]
VFQVLNEQGFGDAASKAKSILLLPVSVNERLEQLRGAIPHDGGLLIKLEAFLLRGEIVRLRSLYFPHLTPPQALDTGTRLAASLAQARTFADLSDRLLRTNEEAFRPWIEAIAKLERYRLGYKLEEGFALDVFPKTFGLYDQVARLFFEGLALKEDQKQDLKYRGVTPDLLLERPWRKFQVSPLLDAALEPFHGAIGGRLNWEAMETTLQAAFSDETDVPTESGLSKTRAILYNEYQAQQPVTDSLTGSVTGGAANPVTESRKPGYFDRIAERLRADGILAYPGSYWLFGGGLDSEDVHGRVYLSLRRRHVEAIYRYLHGPLQAGAKADGAQVQFKIAWNAEGYSRSDSGVIYFDAKDQETIHRLVARMSREHPEFFKDGHPHFTLPLRGENGAVLQGLSFGEQPAYAHQSFGSLRTDAMTGAVRVARALMGTAEPPDWDEVKQICAYFLRRSGVDIENPAFNEGGRAKFGPLLRRNAVPAPAPAPAPRPAVAVNPDDMRALIAREIVERYPGLRAAPAEKLVKVLAKHMYIAWESSGRFAGSSPEAPSYLPEDIFEEKMAQALGRLEKDRGNPTVEPLRQAIADGDQGARVLRQLKARLRHESPLLNDPQNEKLLKTLAGNIYKSWSAGPQTADALEELFRRRLGLLVEHYKTNGTDDPFKQRLRQELETILSHP